MDLVQGQPLNRIFDELRGGHSGWGKLSRARYVAHAVAADGRRFLVVENAGQSGGLHVVLGWETLLERKGS